MQQFDMTAQHYYPNVINYYPNVIQYDLKSSTWYCSTSPAVEKIFYFLGPPKGNKKCSVINQVNQYLDTACNCII
jgi:hypothetical protein